MLRELNVSIPEIQTFLSNRSAENMEQLLREKSYLVTVPTNANASAETEIESMINKAKQYQLHHLHDAAYGSMIPVESLYQGDFQNYSALYKDSL